MNHRNFRAVILTWWNIQLSVVKQRSIMGMDYHLLGWELSQSHNIIQVNFRWKLSYFHSLGDFK